MATVRGEGEKVMRFLLKHFGAAQSIMIVAFAVLITYPLWAQEPTAKAKLEHIDKVVDRASETIAALTARNQWLEKQNQLLAAKLEALMRYYAVDDALKQNEAAKPKEQK